MDSLLKKKFELMEDKHFIDMKLPIAVAKCLVLKFFKRLFFCTYSKP